MLRIMLPLISYIAVVDVLPVVKIVPVDVDVAASPTTTITPATAPSRSQGNAGAPRKKHPRDVTRIAIRGIRIGRRPINNDGVVGGDVNHVWLGLFDDNDLLPTFDRLGLHLLLRSGF